MTHAPGGWPFSKLQPYAVQETALTRAAGRQSFAYLMEMGTGKTLTVLAEFIQLYRAGKISTLIVVCPNSIKHVWAAEAEKAQANLRVCVWPEQMNPGLVASQNVVVINYEAVITKRGGQYIGALLNYRRCMMALDESINIKNPQARRTKILIALGREAGFRRILSGAPVAQGPQDLWAQLRFLGECTSTNFYAFRNHFCRMGGWRGKQVTGSQNEEELNALLGRVAFRARKDEWLDLPKKIYTERTYELTAEQQKHYKSLATDLMTEIQVHDLRVARSGPQSGFKTIEVQMVISALVKMQQVCSGFLLDGEHQAHDLPGPNPKLALLEEILEETTGKVLIFVMFRHTLNTLVTKLGPMNTAWLRGDMGPGNVQQQVERFAKQSQCRYMVAQIQSGKYGHTFLGGPGDDRCATTIFYEHSYSLDNRIQAEDRNHRIGQDRPVVYVDLVGPKVETMIVKALKSKQSVADAVVDNIRHGNL